MSAKTERKIKISIEFNFFLSLFNKRRITVRSLSVEFNNKKFTTFYMNIFITSGQREREACEVFTQFEFNSL